jgi:hypothetical protein
VGTTIWRIWVPASVYGGRKCCHGGAKRRTIPFPVRESGNVGFKVIKIQMTDWTVVPCQWARVVMNQATDALVAALPYDAMDALEISGDAWSWRLNVLVTDENFNEAEYLFARSQSAARRTDVSRSASTTKSSDANDRFLGDTTSRWRGHEGLNWVDGLNRFRGNW